MITIFYGTCDTVCSSNPNENLMFNLIIPYMAELNQVFLQIRPVFYLTRKVVRMEQGEQDLY